MLPRVCFRYYESSSLPREKNVANMVRNLIYRLAPRCPQLQTVNMAYCERLTDAAPAHLARGRCAGGLRGVDFAFCPLLTDAAALHLSRSEEKIFVFNKKTIFI